MSNFIGIVMGGYQDEGGILMDRTELNKRITGLKQENERLKKARPVKTKLYEKMRKENERLELVNQALAKNTLETDKENKKLKKEKSVSETTKAVYAESQELRAVLVKAATSSHKCKELYDWYCKNSGTGKTI